MKKGEPRNIPYPVYKALEKEKELLASRNGALEGQVADLEIQLAGQAVEVATMGEATIGLRNDDVAQIADYQRENTLLIEFVEKIAQTKSKFAREAREILGL